MWNSAWRGVDGSVRVEHAIDWDNDYPVRRYLSRLEASEAGFVWRW